MKTWYVWYKLASLHQSYSALDYARVKELELLKGIGWAYWEGKYTDPPFYMILNHFAYMCFYINLSIDWT